MKDESSGPSPIWDFLGLTVEISAPGQAVGTMLVTEKHFSAAPRMHGGLVFVVFDTVMGSAVHSLVDTDIATIDLHQRFLRMVGPGPLRVTAEVFHPGRRVMQISRRGLREPRQAGGNRYRIIHHSRRAPAPRSAPCLNRPDLRHTSGYGLAPHSRGSRQFGRAVGPEIESRTAHRPYQCRRHVEVRHGSRLTESQ